MEQSQEQKLDYSLDKFDYDYLIMGTGLTECLYSACLSKVARYRNLIIDIDSTYSSSIRTLSLKELHNFLDSEALASVSNTKKKSPFTVIPLRSEEERVRNNSFYQECLDNGAYRSFNIDIQPKLLFSTSSSVDLMRQADMDKYMEFAAITAIFHYDKEKHIFINTPSSKSDIFQHKGITLKEKKQMFGFLHTCIKLFHAATEHEIDQNSTDEFEREFQLDEQTRSTFEQYRDQNCSAYVRLHVESSKIAEIFLYTLASYEFDVQRAELLPVYLAREFTTLNFLKRIAKFVKSCGVHTRLPYLYTKYGTGDIPQGYSRTTSIFGSTICINPKIAVQNLVKCQEREGFTFESNLTGESEQKIYCSRGVITSPAFKHYCEQYLNNNNNEESVEKGNENSSSSTIYNNTTVHLARIVLVYAISKNKKKSAVVKPDGSDNPDEEEKEQPSELLSEPPVVFNIPPNSEELQNLHPVWLLALNRSTQSTPSSFIVVLAKSVVQDTQSDHVQDFADNMQRFVAQKIAARGILPIDAQEPPVYKAVFLQQRSAQGEHRQVRFPDATNLILLAEDNFDIDMDRQFDEFKQCIVDATDAIDPALENYFATSAEINGEVDSNLAPIEKNEETHIERLLQDYSALKNVQKDEVVQGQVPVSETLQNTEQQQSQKIEQAQSTDSQIPANEQNTQEQLQQPTTAAAATTTNTNTTATADESLDQPDPLQNNDQSN